MKLICFGSGSAGNSYVLEADNKDTLLLEAGVSSKVILQKVQYKRIDGLLISHQHL
jgi:phosphoribosyl 1,2-cyclic phosphodiesterase